MRLTLPRRFPSRSVTRGVFLLVTILGGCGPILQHGTPLKTVIDEDRLMENGDYRLQPGDQLEVHHPLDPDYSTLITIPPDGKLSLPGIVGQVQAQGSTVPELTDRLKTLYRQADVLHKPFFSINLRSFGNLQVFVGGEVQRPGFLELAGGDRHVPAGHHVGWRLPVDGAPQRGDHRAHRPGRAVQELFG